MYRNNTDKNYLDLIDLIYNQGATKSDRTGTGTISYFGHQMRFNLLEGFPLVTVKKTFHKAITHELLWFLDAVDPYYKDYGNTNIKYLVDNKVSIWNEWALKPYLEATGKGHIKPNAPEWESVWNDEMKIFVEKVRTDDVFAKQWGELGPVYGKQWTDWGGSMQMLPMPGTQDEYFGGSFGGPTQVNFAPLSLQHIKGINQIENVIHKLRNRPDDRRIIVSAWNVSEIDQMALPPCHAFFQFYSFEMTNEDRVKSFTQWALKHGYDITGMSTENALIHYNFPKRKLNLQLYQRSVDVCIGLPFNIASYALILEMIAQVTDHLAFEFIHTSGDAHIYLNHMDSIADFKNNESYPLPTLYLDRNIKELSDFRIEHINISNYQSHPYIPLKVAV
jgi:thymidylate synthase